MHLNFSELGAQPKPRQNAVLYEAVNHIQMGAMPLRSYLGLHPEAVVTPSQLDVLRNYLASATRVKHAADDTAVAAAGKTMPVQASPNGIAYLPDYKNWKAISSTDRSDTGTLKMILANEVAIQAIAGNHINPWPNGTTFAKVSWRQDLDENGVIRPGEFGQVALMIKDSEKYASTAGWGWAEWLGTELKPYGAGPGFASECVDCHAPLRKNDYVFTMPIQSARRRDE